MDSPVYEADALRRYGQLYSAEQSQALLQQLIREIHWQDSFVAYGRRFEIPRQQAWYAEQGIHYRYAENQLHRHDWIAPLRAIKQKVEDRCGEQFNSVLVTLYRDGKDYVGWHADDEKELGEQPVIASLSLGACREFHYRRKQTGQGHVIKLNDGELLVMPAGFQQDWEHCVPQQSGISMPRLNLTFRRVITLYDMDKAREIMENGYKD